MDAELTFGQWLKKRRKALDLTQEELARRVPCAVITLQKIEAGERRPSKQMAERLAESLGIAVDVRPAFVRFAREGLGAHWPDLLSPAAQVALWSSWPRRRTNLPLAPTPLIGRDRDLTTVCERLLSGANRLLTLIGPPGVGKTRLAIGAGSNLLDDFGDGVYLVELASVSDPSLVAASVAQTPRGR